ncbi:hypothetical protein RhiirA4_498395, partial [Rhizophagus irregularis]
LLIIGGVYKCQQRFLNPENIPRKKKTSLYKVSPRHLELWIEDSFVRIFDQPAFDSLGFAWSRAKRDNIPFWAACNVHFNNNKIKTAPIKSHATLTEISHIGINLYDHKNLPETWVAPFLNYPPVGPLYLPFSKRMLERL